MNTHSCSTSGRRGSCPPAFLPSRGRRPAREIATRELRSEWSISKPARALRSLRRPHAGGACAVGVGLKPGLVPPLLTSAAAWSTRLLCV